MIWTRRKPIVRHRNRVRLASEPLEPRLVLAVTAAGDSYSTLEDVGFATGSTAIVPRRSQGGWAVFDDVPLVGANANTYPDTNQAAAKWYSRAYNIAQSSFASWETIPNQGLSAPFEFESVTVLSPGTTIDAPATKTNTVLARKTFALTAAQAAVTQMTLDYVCDDGCVIYLNDREVLRSNLPAAGAITPNTRATASGLENAYTSTTLDLAALGVSLQADATNVLAIEVHNIDPASSDLGFDLALSIAGGQANTRANDTTNAAVGAVNSYFWDGNAATLNTTTAVSGPVFAAAGGVQVGTVTIESASGNFRFDPVTTGPGVNFVGNAAFQYALRDGSGTTAATVTIAIAALNDAPVVTPDKYTIVRGSGPLVVGATAGSTYISPGSQWFYSDAGGDQHVVNPEWVGPAAAGFAPESGGELGWNPVAGTAPLGFGNGNEATQLATTAATYYFFRKFNVTGATPSMLRMGLRADDCAAVYINGFEVYRTPNLPYLQGNLSLCTSAVDGVAEDVFMDVTIPTAGLNLLSANNTISVEVHQVSSTSSDVAFDLSLRNGLEGVRANDLDSDDPTSELVVEVVDQGQFTAAVGTLVVSANGAFTFTPANANVTGTFSFTYRLTDNGQPTAPAMASRAGTATITVLSAPRDQPPQSYPESYEVLEDGVLTIAEPQWPVPLGGEWQYFDEMQNGLQIPTGPAENYPTDAATDVDATPGVSDPWYSEHFNVATSDSSIGTWKTGRAMFAGPIRGMAAGRGRTPLLGIGDGDAGRNSVNTYLFRRTFLVEEAASITEFAIYFLIDDGAIIRINDVELRLRLPATAVTSTTLATGGSDEVYHPQIIPLDAPLFREGLNTISVEVHQVSLDSSDVGFDVGIAFPRGAGVLANDEAAAVTDTLAARVVRDPLNGTVAMNSDGAFTYTPNPDFNGTDSFEYVAVSNGLESLPTRVDIDVVSVPDPPVAVNDVYSAPNDETLVISAANGVLANDTGDGPLRIVLAQSGGEVVAVEGGEFIWNGAGGGFADGSIIFEPKPGYVGSFTLPYTVEDVNGLRSVASVTINVTSGTSPEDLDGDGSVTMADLAIVVGNFGLDSALASDGDLNGNGRVEFADAIRLRNAIPPGGSAPAAILAEARAKRGVAVDAVMRNNLRDGWDSRSSLIADYDLNQRLVARRRVAASLTRTNRDALLDSEVETGAATELNDSGPRARRAPTTLVGRRGRS